ncbi:pre-mRNA-processing factor 40, putative [Plasmodium chabaudi adami]|uniref:Pre-mRNA-processing factor 40, putative n=2 Tax=Plasmodium chabaudi adami TaxID=5826 RepID=A0A1C6YMM1_PLACE|nr:pre-mRNA-processing factor 40, putative [Plasmodium chabaudi adami]
MSNPQNKSNLGNFPNTPNLGPFPNLPNIPNLPAIPGFPGLPNVGLNNNPVINNSGFLNNNAMPLPFLPGIIPNMNPSYENFNPLMHPQNNNNMNVPLPPSNPNMLGDMMKMYNKDFMLNNSNQMINNNLINPANNMPLNFMTNFNVNNHGWCEMTAKNGRKYYYNTITKISKWDKPDELKTKLELRISQNTKWKEYSCSDGRKYWHHEEKNISVWDEPEEIKKIRLECESEENENNADTKDSEANAEKGNQNQAFLNEIKNKDTTILGSNTPIISNMHDYANIENKTNFDNINKMNSGNVMNNNNNMNPSGKWVKFENKKDAREHLKILFEEKNINPKLPWENALRILEEDYRWQTLVILTKGEKKQLFSEYTSHAIKKSAEDERRKRQKSRELIFQALVCWNKLNERTTYIDFATEFHNEVWWNWISETERDEIFQDFLDDCKQKFKDERRKKRKEKSEILKEKFQKYANENNSLKWEDIQNYFSNDEDFNSIHKIDALAAWESFYEKYYNNEKNELKKKIFRILRKKRDSFIELLNEYHEKNILNMKTEWVFFVSKIYKDDRYTDLLGHQGSTPRILFDEFTDTLKEQYLRHKYYIKSSYKENDCTVDENTTLEDFVKLFANTQKEYNIPEINMNYIYESLQKKLKEKKKKDLKRINKVAKFLLKLPELKPNMPYNKVISIIKNSSKWPVISDLCPKEEHKLAAYDIWKSNVNSKKRGLSTESINSNSHKNGKSQRKKDSLKYTDEDNDDNDGDDKPYSKHRKYSREDSDSSAQTIESLRTVDNVST